jgi:hypothetical protein
MPEGVPAMIVSRFKGPHQMVSTNKTVLPEVAEIALNWMDLALYGTQAAYDALTSDNVCVNCTPEHWFLTAKNLETLLQ